MSRGLYHLLRIFFGMALLAAALGKLLDNRAFATVLEAYRVGLSEDVALPVALLVACTELAIAVALLGGTRARLAAVALVALIGLYTGVVVTTVRRALHVPDCGCFGVFASMPVDMELVAVDALLLALALAHALAAFRHGGPRVRNVFRPDS